MRVTPKIRRRGSGPVRRGAGEAVMTLLSFEASIAPVGGGCGRTLPVCRRPVKGCPREPTAGVGVIAARRCAGGALDGRDSMGGLIDDEEGTQVRKRDSG